MDIETQLIFDDFQGGRFYRGRYVYLLSVRLPVIDYGFWTTDIGGKVYKELRAFAEMCYAPKSFQDRGTGRNKRSATVFSFHNDTPTFKLFGLSQQQYFNRMLKQKSIVAVDRGRSGWWYTQHDLLPLVRYRKKSHHVVGRVAKDKRDLFAPVLVEPVDKMREDAKPGDFEYYAVRSWPLPDYSKLDLGPDRLPEVWVCNLCEHTDVYAKWPRQDGLLGEYIHHCPKCQARGADTFHRIVDLAKDSIAFKPRRRMQDDFYFTLQ